MYGIKLDASGDIDLSSGSTILTSDLLQLKDALTAYLKMNKGSWFEDRRRGFPLTRNNSTDTRTEDFLSTFYYSKLKAYRDITSVVSFTASVDKRTRVFTINFTAYTTYSVDPVTLNLEV